MKLARGVGVACLVFAGACGGGKERPPMVPESAEPEPPAASEPAETTEASTPDAPDAPGGSEESARSLLAQFLDPSADHAALSKSLRPTSADYKSMFDTTTAAKVEASQEQDWESGRLVIKPKDKQTEVKVFGATGADLAAGTGNAREFPGGYKKIASHLAPTVTFYAFKFVAPGKSAGMAYDGLAFVNGHWVIAPKPWRAVDAAPAADDPPPRGPKPSKPNTKKNKKKPKKKKK